MESEEEKKQSNDSSFLKWLLTSVVGTTISIALTFGTAHIIEEHKKEVEGRRAAMMVIHDMDNYVETFKSLAEEETTNHDKAVYAIAHLDNLNAVPKDTLRDVAFYITNVDDYNTIDESTEKTFLSSQDTWKNIKSPSFIDIAQAFFHERRMVYEQINNTDIFAKPVPFSELFELIANSRDNEYVIDYTGFLSKKLRDNHILYYLDLVTRRIEHYNNIADEWQHKSDQCKFMMNITDEEMKTYLSQRKSTGAPLKERQLIGKWKTKEEVPQLYEFKNDHSFVHSVIKTNIGYSYSGPLRIIYTFKGKWSIKDDTLHREYDPGFDFKIDESEITVREGMRDSLDRMLDKNRKMLTQRKELKQQRPPINRCARIDKSGNKIELSWNGPDEKGEVKDQTSYFIRMTKNEK